MSKRKNGSRSPMTNIKILLLFLALGLVFWSAPFLGSFAEGILQRLLRLFGVGAMLPGLALGVLAWVVYQRRFSLLWHYWNCWLGTISWATALFGVLALFDLSGSLGEWFMSTPWYADLLRLLALTIAGMALIAPEFTLEFLLASARKGNAVFHWLLNLLERGASKLYQTFARRFEHRRVPPQYRQMGTSPSEIEELPPFEAKTASDEVVVASPPQAAVPTVGATKGEPIRKDRKREEVSAKGWQLPPLDLLELPAEMELGQADIERRARLIEEALASYGVEAKVVQINAGPAVTQFGVEPGWERKYKGVKERDKNGSFKARQEEVSRTRVRIERIRSLADDLALALAAPSIRIEAPIPGKTLVGIEVPNSTKGTATLRSVLESATFRKLQSRANLVIALGKAAGGEAVVAELPKMPHLLIAGATGSGKTICLNSIVVSLLMHATPDELQLLLVDPKRVELVSFNTVPHLGVPVIVDRDRAVEVLNWLNQEMDSRYRKMAVVGVRNLEAYNSSSKVEKRLPYIVVVIDELADLMMSRPEQVEPTICRLAQLARATGIHMVVATQRPSVDVITGLIKANFPSRIAFAVASQVDSRTILDIAGADKLLGRGDMLFLPTDATKPRRCQGCFVSDQEIDRVVKHWAKQRRLKEEALLSMPPVSGGESLAKDPLMEEARRLAREHKQVSVSFLQRQLRIGYNRATQLMEQLQKETAKETPAEEEKKNPGSDVSG